jgi:hypothetical protein
MIISRHFYFKIMNHFFINFIVKLDDEIGLEDLAVVSVAGFMFLS